ADPAPRLPSGLAEGEHVHAGAGLQEGDLERALLDAAGLTDELVEPRERDGPVPLLVEVRSGGRARCLSVEEHAEPDGRSRFSGLQHEMEVAGPEAEYEPAAGLVHDGTLRP